jgi:hypothetical protein
MELPDQVAVVIWTATSVISKDLAAYKLLDQISDPRDGIAFNGGRTRDALLKVRFRESSR